MKDQFTWIDVDRELVKMRAWLTTPKGRGRKLTRRFIVAWLSKCDGRQVETPKQHRYDAMSV